MPSIVLTPKQQASAAILATNATAAQSKFDAYVQAIADSADGIEPGVSLSLDAARGVLSWPDPEIPATPIRSLARVKDGT